MFCLIALIDKAWKSGKGVYIITIHSTDDEFLYDAPNMEEKGQRDSKALKCLMEIQPNLSGIILADLDYTVGKIKYILKKYIICV